MFVFHMGIDDFVFLGIVTIFVLGVVIAFGYCLIASLVSSVVKKIKSVFDRG